MAKCDFCSELNPTSFFEAEPFFALISIPGKVQQLIQDDGNWTACDVCAKLIYERNCMALTRRSLETYAKPLGINYNDLPIELTIYTNLLHSHFFRSVKLPSRN